MDESEGRINVEDVYIKANEHLGQKEEKEARAKTKKGRRKDENRAKTRGNRAKTRGKWTRNRQGIDGKRGEDKEEDVGESGARNEASTMIKTSKNGSLNGDSRHTPSLVPSPSLPFPSTSDSELGRGQHSPRFACSLASKEERERDTLKGRMVKVTIRREMEAMIQ